MFTVRSVSLSWKGSNEHKQSAACLSETTCPLHVFLLFLQKEETPKSLENTVVMVLAAIGRHSLTLGIKQSQPMPSPPLLTLQPSLLTITHTRSVALSFILLRELPAEHGITLGTQTFEDVVRVWRPGKEEALLVKL